MKLRYFLVAAIPFVIAASCIDTIPPKSLTETNMTLTKRRILLYAQAHQELPPNLTSLASMKGYHNDVRDGWNRPLIYSTNAAGIVTLQSLGRDGVPGGTGDNADISHSFPTRDAKGKWSDEFVNWSTPR